MPVAKFARRKPVSAVFLLAYFTPNHGTQACPCKSTAACSSLRRSAISSPSLRSTNVPRQSPPIDGNICPSLRRSAARATAAISAVRRKRKPVPRTSLPRRAVGSPRDYHVASLLVMTRWDGMSLRRSAARATAAISAVRRKRKPVPRTSLPRQAVGLPRDYHVASLLVMTGWDGMSLRRSAARATAAIPAVRRKYIDISLQHCY